VSRGGAGGGGVDTLNIANQDMDLKPLY